MVWLSLLKLSGIGLVVLSVASGGSYFIGYERGHNQALLAAEKAKTAAVTKAALDARALGIAEGTITITAGQHFAETQTNIVTRTITQIKEVPIYVTPKADAACVVNAGFVQLHDSAAREPSAAAIPDAAGQSPDGPSGVALSEVAATVVANYGTYYQTRAQLIALQEWVKQQQSLHR